jgi:hypothetical protein
MVVLCGVETVEKTPFEPYSDVVCDMLDEYSAALRQDTQAKTYPDVMTFAFWARKANILRHKEEFCSRNVKRRRLGKGIVFHIAPSNVPVNFMFSYAFGLLAGNANIVRVPSRLFPQVDCMCRVLEQVLSEEKYSRLRSMTSIVRYEKKKAVTDQFSALCNMRVIWGGDSTIQEIRTSPIPPRSTEITFADRYSFGVIHVPVLLETSSDALQTLAKGFYNDTYLMDQNACSAPHLICWDLAGASEEEWRLAQSRFWDSVLKEAAKYDLEDIKVSEKYALLCENMIENSAITNLVKYDNLLYVCDIGELSGETVTKLRGKYGLFFQYKLNNLEELSVLFQEKVQTCASYGTPSTVLASVIMEHGGCGIDRIVPFGKTLDIDVLWDGYDLVEEMSRVIAVY